MCDVLFAFFVLFLCCIFLIVNHKIVCGALLGAPNVLGLNNIRD